MVQSENPWNRRITKKKWKKRERETEICNAIKIYNVQENVGHNIGLGFIESENLKHKLYIQIHTFIEYKALNVCFIVSNGF